jgi:hypothetical protein
MTYLMPVGQLRCIWLRLDCLNPSRSGLSEDLRLQGTNWAYVVVHRKGYEGDETYSITATLSERVNGERGAYVYRGDSVKLRDHLRRESGMVTEHP